MTTTSISNVRMKDGATLKVKLLGPSNPAIPLLIAHHGAPGAFTHAETEANFSFLASRFRVLVFDARGSGDSELQPPYSHEQWVSDVDELRIWAGAEKIILAGGSYGGIVSLEYACAHPDRLLALILSSTTAYGQGTADNVLSRTTSNAVSGIDAARQKRCWTGTLLNDLDYQEAWLEILPLVVTKVKEKETSNERIEEKRREEEEAVKKHFAFHAATQNAAFGVEIPKYDVREKLSSISVPTLIMVGTQDVICPIPFSEEIQRGIKNSEVVVFENSGHGIAIDEQEKFQKCVSNFLSRLRLCN